MISRKINSEFSLFFKSIRICLNGNFFAHLYKSDLLKKIEKSTVYSLKHEIWSPDGLVHFGDLKGTLVQEFNVPA